jgi:hypothetical protein
MFVHALRLQAVNHHHVCNDKDLFSTGFTLLRFDCIPHQNFDVRGLLAGTKPAVARFPTRPFSAQEAIARWEGATPISMSASLKTRGNAGIPTSVSSPQCSLVMRQMAYEGSASAER